MEIRRIRDDEIAECARLANSIFRREGQKSMEESFPGLYSKGSRQSFGIFEDSRLVSFLGMTPSVVRIGEARVNVLSVGSVCTHPEVRGKGYAGRLLEAAKEYAALTDASLMLVSGDRPMYTSADCHKFGSVKKFVLEHGKIDQSGRFEAVAVREWEPEDLFHLKNLADQREIHYEQSISDLAVFIAAEGIGRRRCLRFKVLIAERAGEVRAYAIIAIPQGRAGEDGSLAVEWAGDAGLTAGLFAHAVTHYRLSELMVPVNWHETELLQLLDAEGFSSTPSRNLGTVHLVNPERLLRQSAPYGWSSEAASVSRLQIDRMPDGNYRAGLPESGPVVLTHGELVSLLFDPDALSSIEDPVKQGLFPLLLTPFPYAGGLNYV